MGAESKGLFMAKLVGAARTNVGLKRANNEDSFFVDESLGLFMVADGMGGAASGEVASRLVVEAISDYVRHFIHQAMEVSERFDFYDGNLSPAANTLMQAVHLANDLVYQASHKEDRHEGMGSTLAAVMFDGEHVLVTNVGDSRIFRWRDGKLERLTVDHRMSDEPRLQGMIQADATIMTTLGNTLTRAMGVRRIVEPALRVEPLQEDDIYLLCSDGLSDMVKEDMIAKVVSLERSLEQKAKDLVDLALAGGGRDNITVVLASAPRGGLKGLLSKITKSN